MKRLLPPLVALLLCVSILWVWTDGFRAFTVFSYALNQAGPLPRAFPDAVFVNQDGATFHLQDKKKFVLVNFVYLDCPDVCHKINNRLEGIYRKLAGGIIPADLELLTISFDLQRDNVRKIKSYKQLFGEGLSGWTFALPEGMTQESFDQFLRTLGVWARRVPGTAIINHSIYQFLVAPNGEIVKVFDPAREDDRQIIEELKSWVQK